MMPVTAPEMGSMSSQVEIFLSAFNLPNKDLLSKSDTFAVFYVGNPEYAGKWSEIARTETVMDNLSPQWTTQIKLEYRFEEVQYIRVEVYDRDSKSNKLKDHDSLGFVESQLGTLFGSRGQTLHLPLNKGKKQGFIIIKGEEIRESNQSLCIQFAGKKLDKKDFLGKSDPFIEAHRVNEDGSSMKVWESAVIKNNLNPVWKPVEIPLQTLSNGDIHRPIKWVVYDWDKSSDNDVIGACMASVNEIMQAGFSRDLINEEKQRKKKKYKNSGVLTVAAPAKMITTPSFLDYISGGCELNLTVAVDFTGSNGNPKSPSSLHYISTNMNEYQCALSAVGQILMNYDSDQMIPMYQFGGVPPGLGTQHCYPINLNPAAPEVCGVQGMLECYQQGIQTIGLSGPTYFSHILRTVIERTKMEGCMQDVQKYQLLLILTDGVINDMQQTIANLVEMSAMPISVVIVGVGNANFDSMEMLDGDDGVLKSGGRAAVRDIVQFVPFRDFKHKHFSYLAKHTLAEIPGQFLKYMKACGIVPNPKTLFAPVEVPMAATAVPVDVSAVPMAVPCQAPVSAEPCAPCAPQF
eukprot:TRINITY_DN1303_c0_g3_i2.p1 TRINITY_DN1303_c0_g3~~TRINITY_DN1303_c0_g3_i2.p1  ORF type:complete len:576 (+),score=188.39 TRINITY_DN1303_c0_g3_i2:43-1770(+)